MIVFAAKKVLPEWEQLSWKEKEPYYDEAREKITSPLLNVSPGGIAWEDETPPQVETATAIPFRDAGQVDVEYDVVPDRKRTCARKTSRYTQLLTAVQDLLCELRIDEWELHLISKGYSPDYPGPIAADSSRCTWHNPHRERVASGCKVQLSKVVASKLIAAGLLDHVQEER